MEKDIKELFQKGEEGIASGDWEKACDILGFALEKCDRLDDQASAAHARRLLGDAETLRGRFAEAGSHYMKALGYLLKSPDPNETAICLRGLGYLHWRKGDYNMANEYLQQGLERALQAGNKGAQGCILTDMGNVASSQGKLDAGERLFKQAIAVLEGITDSNELDRALLNLGDTVMTKGDLIKASDYFEQAIVQSRMRNDNSNLSWALLNLAECRVRQGYLSKVEDLLTEAKAIMSESGDRVGLAAAKRVRGQLDMASGDWEEAEDELEDALADYQEMDMPERRAVVYRLYGEMLVQKGDKARARTMLEMALDIFKELGSEKELDITKALMEGFAKEGRL